MEEFNNKSDAPIDATSLQDCTTEKDEMDVGTKGNKYKSMVKLDYHRH